ncbi:hypothetical protein B0H17DRAFT_1135577 [Mycena rosella]|uniref:Uncharacterized protein n=1 Tax=Mycena rosella TaxID=1033263 RepID=A0AAD7GFE5_MYCRO|nr:hypothetical protein B0H17DRAFT_1135577 [Mycena rosella]
MACEAVHAHNKHASHDGDDERLDNMLHDMFDYANNNADANDNKYNEFASLQPPTPIHSASLIPPGLFPKTPLRNLLDEVHGTPEELPKQHEVQEAGIQLAPATAPVALSSAATTSIKFSPLAKDNKKNRKCPSTTSHNEQPLKHLKMEAFHATLVQQNKPAQPIPIEFNEDLSLLGPPPAIPHAHPVNSGKPTNRGSVAAASGLHPPAHQLYMEMPPVPAALHCIGLSMLAIAGPSIARPREQGAHILDCCRPVEGVLPVCTANVDGVLAALPSLSLTVGPLAPALPPPPPALASCGGKRNHAVQEATYKQWKRMTKEHAMPMTHLFVVMVLGATTVQDPISVRGTTLRCPSSLCPSVPYPDHPLIISAPLFPLAAPNGTWSVIRPRISANHSGHMVITFLASLQNHPPSRCFFAATHYVKYIGSSGIPHQSAIGLDSSAISRHPGWMQRQLPGWSAFPSTHNECQWEIVNSTSLYKVKIFQLHFT